MLILQRKADQSIMIGDDIRITVLDIGNDSIKLAIDAPRDISILRAELLEAASANQEAAAISLSANSISRIKDLIEQKHNGNT